VTEAQAVHGKWPISHATVVDATESRQSDWRDSGHVAPRRNQTTLPRHGLRQCTWCDSFISCANRTGVTQEGKILEISFSRVHFQIFFSKRTKIKKNHPQCTSTSARTIHLMWSLLMAKFGKSEKMGLSGFLFWTVRFRQF
jgi:hypothetical protein